jgi:hypothetical protein
LRVRVTEEEGHDVARGDQLARQALGIAEGVVSLAGGLSRSRGEEHPADGGSMVRG